MVDHGMMIDVRVRLGANGRIVIPADVRRRLGVEAGDELIADRRRASERE